MSWHRTRPQLKQKEATQPAISYDIRRTSTEQGGGCCTVLVSNTNRLCYIRVAVAVSVPLPVAWCCF